MKIWTQYGRLMGSEMPATEQLFDTNVDHLGFGHSAHPQAEPDMECSESALHGCVGEHAQAHGQH
jgi:hypothetical protein